MECIITNESWKASTRLVQPRPSSIDRVVAFKNSTAAFQILLQDGKKNHYNLDYQYSIPDEIETPIYRVVVESELDCDTKFIEGSVKNLV
jgi:dsRNA-specific ribonuclease